MTPCPRHDWSQTVGGHSWLQEKVRSMLSILLPCRSGQQPATEKELGQHWARLIAQKSQWRGPALPHFGKDVVHEIRGDNPLVPPLRLEPEFLSAFVMQARVRSVSQRP